MNEDKRKLYAMLSAPFTDEAIERTEGRVTGKGYDTTGIKYQYVVNRMNEVLGVGGWRTQQAITVREITTSKGRPAFDATCDITLQLGEWVDGKFVPWAETFATGGHQSVSESDAKKGSYTNALKKGAAMLGCGKQAYEGTLDDDNLPATETFQPQPPHSQSSAEQKPQPQAAPQPVSTYAQPREEASNPAPVQQYDQQHAEQHRSQPAANNTPSRNRLTSKQLAAIWALARKLNYQQSPFRQQVRLAFGCQPEFLSKTDASTLIGQLSQQASNGHSHPTGEHPEA